MAYEAFLDLVSNAGLILPLPSWGFATHGVWGQPLRSSQQQLQIPGEP